MDKLMRLDLAVVGGASAGLGLASYTRGWTPVLLSAVLACAAAVVFGVIRRKFLKPPADSFRGAVICAACFLAGLALVPGRKHGIPAAAVKKLIAEGKLTREDAINGGVSDPEWEEISDGATEITLGGSTSSVRTEVSTDSLFDYDDYDLK